MENTVLLIVDMQEGLLKRPPLPGGTTAVEYNFSCRDCQRKRH